MIHVDCPATLKASCVCVCVREREKEGGEKEREREREREYYCLITDACVNIYFSIIMCMSW